MEKQFQVVFTANVDAATLKVKMLDNEEYLVGPVVMAKQIVMNGIYYPAQELKVSTAHWNGRPVVVNHPKDKDGNYVTANDPATLEACGLGFVFGTVFHANSTKLKAECWLKKSKIASFPEVKTIIDNGDMFEVSTGLFMDKEEKAGTYNEKDYTFVGHNYKPDHLAILPNATGAMSIKEGAGFPRANIAEQLEANEISLFEKNHIVGKAIRKSFSNGNNWAYLTDLFDGYVIYEVWSENDMSYELFKVNYTLGTDDQTVTFDGTPTKVICQKTYVDKMETNVLQPKSTVEPNQTKGEGTMNRKEKIKGWTDANLIDANQVATLEKVDDATFELFATNFDKLNDASKKPAPVEKKPEGNEEEGKPVVEKKPEVNALELDAQLWAKGAYSAAREQHITAILGNSANTFKREALDVMSINQLESIAALATNTTDMSAAGAGANAETIKANKKETPKVAPLVNKATVSTK